MKMTSGLRNALLAGAAISVTAGAAIAQVTSPNAPLKLTTDYFGYAAGVSVRASYSDNIALRRGPLEDDEYILSTFLTGGAIYSSPRVTAIVLGDLDFSYLFDQSDLAINQNIGATSTFTGVDNWLYFDLSGSTSRQLIGDNARFSGNINAARGQRADVHAYSASPYVFHQFADQSSTELRYRFSQVFVDQETSPLAFLTGNSNNDSTTHEVLAQYDTGRAFNRLNLRFTAFGSDTTEDGFSGIPDFEYRQGMASVEGRFYLTDSFAISGAGGYDDVNTSGSASLFFNDDVLSGGFWRAGFTAQPGPRSFVRLEYGKRYGDDFIDAQARYALSERFVFNAGASRTFRTRAQSVSSQFRATQRQTLEFADRLREGAELSARGVIESANWYANSLNFGRAQTTGVAVTDSAYASLAGRFNRTDLSINGYYSDDNFGYRQIETIGGGFDLRRQLSRRLTGYGSIAYRRADTAFDPATCEANPQFFGFDTTDPLFNAMTDCANLALQNGITNTVIGKVGASYALYENVSAFAEVSHTERFAPNSLLEYNENTALVGVTLDF
ncbi:hypothetical protein [Hyphococcus sp.]|uniref:hypothetical protein n=1 Tax=Hyphococcus sp. TaxID=2038636 RepID=UPI003CCC2F9C